MLHSELWREGGREGGGMVEWDKESCEREGRKQRNNVCKDESKKEQRKRKTDKVRKEKTERGL